MAFETKFDKCKKISFRNRKEAKNELKRINRHKGNTKLKNVYICPICETWHLTSIDKITSRSFNK